MMTVKAPGTTPLFSRERSSPASFTAFNPMAATGGISSPSIVASASASR
jgi:hypothetical protein